jgi:nitroreductase/NAD-dependent dihydropyrimidine dehydrogenase PreA subunit
MPIMGIDYTKCSQCKYCIDECPTKNYSLEEEEKKVIFKPKACILCGHCIAICPENAVLYEDMRDIPLEFEEPIDFLLDEALFKLIRSKRSIRRYKSQKVPHEIIEKIIESIRYAPAAINLRNLKSIIISGKKKIEEFTYSIIESMESGKQKENLKKSVENGINPFFYNAPHILMLHSKNGWGEVNATIALTYAMLYAETLGIGSCWIGGIQKYFLGNREVTERILGISNKICGMMIFGYPAVKYHRSPPRPPLEVNEI